jgi:hypothetical protein
VPRPPETRAEARWVNKMFLRPPRILIAASLAFIDAVLEVKYVKCRLVRTIFALVSIAKRLSH